MCLGLQEKVAKAQEVKDVAMVSLSQAIEEEKKEQWRAEGRSMLFDAKRVNADTDACITAIALLHSLTPGFSCSLSFGLAFSEFLCIYSDMSVLLLKLRTD